MLHIASIPKRKMPNVFAETKPQIPNAKSVVLRIMSSTTLGIL